MGNNLSQISDHSRTAQCFLIMMTLLVGLALTGCASNPTSKILENPHAFYATTPFIPSGPIKANNIVCLRQVTFVGPLAKRRDMLYAPFQEGFGRIGPEIRCSQNLDLCEGYIDVTIKADYAASNMSKLQYVPILGGAVNQLSGSELVFNWNGMIEYTLHDPDGILIAVDTVAFTGEDTMEMKGVNGAINSLTSLYVGSGPAARRYPDDRAVREVGDSLLKLAGFEIGKRLRSEPGAAFFVARTAARDGMDPATYAEFLARKQQLQVERTRLQSRHRDALQGKIRNRNRYDSLKQGSVMVFGVGVDRYEHFPNLNYAASDSRHFVSFMKKRYSLTDNWAINVTDKEATAIKVRRFLEHDAARLLTEDDTFIFYFSGHGAPEPDAIAEDGDGLKKYLLLANSEPGALSLTALSLDDLAALLRELPCRRLLLFIDSCFAGVAGRETFEKIKGAQISDQTYHKMASISGSGRVILAASTENQFSLETKELQAGIFTHYLIEGLEGTRTDTNDDKRVDVLELFNYVLDNVSRKTNGLQTPVFRGALDRNIVF